MGKGLKPLRGVNVMDSLSRHFSAFRLTIGGPVALSRDGTFNRPIVYSLIAGAVAIRRGVHAIFHLGPEPSWLVNADSESDRSAGVEGKYCMDNTCDYSKSVRRKWPNPASVISELNAILQPIANLNHWNRGLCARMAPTTVV